MDNQWTVNGEQWTENAWTENAMGCEAEEQATLRNVAGIGSSVSRKT